MLLKRYFILQRLKLNRERAENCHIDLLFRHSFLHQSCQLLSVGRAALGLHSAVVLD